MPSSSLPRRCGRISGAPIWSRRSPIIAAACAATVPLLARAEPSWFALGLLWIAVPCVLLLWLAQPREIGPRTVLWIFAVVWATDIGAYLIGRQVGGPRLAPSWSPRKTWAGMIGGAGCAALAGWGTARLVDTSALPLVLVSAGLAIIEQFGDLAESVAKRRFGVKDTSGLIPGHGGLLDRLDGLLAVIPAVALFTLIAGAAGGRRPLRPPGAPPTGCWPGSSAPPAWSPPWPRSARAASSPSRTRRCWCAPAACSCARCWHMARRCSRSIASTTPYGSASI